MQARAWLEANFPKSLARAAPAEGEAGGEKPTGDPSKPSSVGMRLF